MPATDLAPILAMLDDCGFTRTRFTRQPSCHWYKRDVGDQQITVAVYPYGNAVPHPNPPAPCMHIYVHGAEQVGFPQLWEAHFNAGTPAPVIIAALSAAMHDATGTQPPEVDR